MHGFAAICSINGTCTKITKLTSFVILAQVPFMLQLAANTCKRKTMPHLKVKGGKCLFGAGETFKRNTCNTLWSRRGTAPSEPPPGGKLKENPAPKCLTGKNAAVVHVCFDFRRMPSGPPPNTLRRQIPSLFHQIPSRLAGYPHFCTPDTLSGPPDALSSSPDKLTSRQGIGSGANLEIKLRRKRARSRRHRF